MDKNRMGRFGAVSSIIVGIAYLVIGLIQIRLPAEQTCDCAELFWLSYLNFPVGLNTQYAAFALTGLLGMAVVMAVSDSIRSETVGWVNWARNLAIMGFALTAIDNFHALDLNYDKAFAYVNTLGAKEPLSTPGSLTGLDANGWFRFGAIGLWLLAVNLLALRTGAWPKLLAYIGIAGAVAYFLLLVGNTVGPDVLVLIGAGAGGIILGPIWYIWMGLRLYDAA